MEAERSEDKVRKQMYEFPIGEGGVRGVVGAALDGAVVAAAIICSVIGQFAQGICIILYVRSAYI